MYSQVPFKKSKDKTEERTNIKIHYKAARNIALPCLLNCQESGMED